MENGAPTEEKPTESEEADFSITKINAVTVYSECTTAQRKNRGIQ